MHRSIDCALISIFGEPEFYFMIVCICNWKLSFKILGLGLRIFGGLSWSWNVYVVLRVWIEQVGRLYAVMILK